MTAAQHTPGSFSGPFMKLPPLLPGHVWNDVAPMGEAPKWVMVPFPVDWHRTTEEISRDGDRLFGYEREAFLRRQYKPTNAAIAKAEGSAS